MSAKWIRVETDIVDHPKVGRLEVLLNNPCAGWYVMRAMSWLSRFCPTGHVRDIDGTSLERSCQWRGDAGELLRALVSSGWLDEVHGGGWEWHDWSDHQGKVADKAKKERERKQIYRAKKAAEAAHLRAPAAPEMSRGTSTGHPAQRDVTERDGTSLKTMSGKPDSVELDAALTDDEFQVFEHWRQGRRPRAKATPERKRIIARALKAYSVEDLQRAIDGLSRSPHHMGQNERHQIYDDIELVLRDAKHIETFMKLGGAQ